MKYIPCNLCGADNWTVRFPATLGKSQPDVRAFRCTSAGYGEHTQIVECYECGYVYANPTWDSADLIHAYTIVEDETYVQEREGRELTFRKHLEKIEAITGSANGRTLLDVGAYIGVFVEIAQQAGWQACGIEPSEWAVAEAKKHNLPILQGTLNAPELRGRQFDVVTLWDVIEHLDDPHTELRKVWKVTKPGGLVAVHTMDIGSLTARLLGSRWPWLMAMHVHFFSKRTLSQMMVQSGFEIVKVQTEGRYLRLGYLATRLGGLNKMVGRMVGGIIGRFGWSAIPVPINFGDLFTVYARRPLDS